MKIWLLRGPGWAGHGEWAGLCSLPPTGHREGYWLNTNRTSAGSSLWYSTLRGISPGAVRVRRRRGRRRAGHREGGGGG